MSFKKHESQGTGKYAFLNKGKVVAYVDGKREEYDSIEGRVLAIDFEMRKYEDREYEAVVLFMQDGDATEHMLLFPLESGYGSAFCKMAKNVDWKRPLEISAKIEEKGSKKYTSMFIKQPDDNGKWTNIKWAYTEAAPLKMPPAEKKKDRNGEYNDYTKRNEWFRKLLIDYVGKEIKKASPNFDLKKAKDNAKAAQEAKNITEPIDDLPF